MKKFRVLVLGRDRWLYGKRGIFHKRRRPAVKMSVSPEFVSQLGKPVKLTVRGIEVGEPVVLPERMRGETRTVVIHFKKSLDGRDE